MECEEVRGLVGAFLGAKEPGPWPTPVARHLEACQGCRTAQEEIGRTWALLRGWPEVEPGAEARKRVLRGLRRQLVRESVLTFRGWVPAVLASAIGIGLSLILSLAVHYPVLVRWCRELLQASDLDAAPYLLAGFVYGVPLAVGVWILRREALPRALIGTLEAGLLFVLVLAPYVIAECREFAPPLRAVFFMGLVGGTITASLASLCLARLRKPVQLACLTVGLLSAIPVPLTAGDLSTEVDGIRVELKSAPETPRAGEETTYNVRLLDRTGTPLNGAKVTLQGRMADGMTVLAPLSPSPEPGVYRGRLLFTMEGRWDLTLRVARGKPFELPLIEQVER